MRAGNRCEFPRGCERKNNGIVHHLTGVYEGHLKGVPDETISDVTQNAFMLCEPHAKAHDIEEKEQVIFYGQTRFREVSRRRNRRTQQYRKPRPYRKRR